MVHGSTCTQREQKRRPLGGRRTLVLVVMQQARSISLVVAILEDIFSTTSPHEETRCSEANTKKSLWSIVMVLVLNSSDTLLLSHRKRESLPKKKNREQQRRPQKADQKGTMRTGKKIKGQKKN
eukprot:703762-Amphidinium_carterae.1